MRGIGSVCVYCGSRKGKRENYEQVASALGKAIAKAGLTLVYGGGAIGLMGVVARACLSEDGQVVGVIPEFLRNREVAFNDASELIITEDMHERKATMFARADAFIAIPGGLGTLEEIVEMATWRQLGQHSKPLLLLNTEGFWQPLLALLETMVKEGFLEKETLDVLVVVESVEEAIAHLCA